MKKQLITAIVILWAMQSFAQVVGNAYYNSSTTNQIGQVRYPTFNIPMSSNFSNDIIISVKGMSNIKADSYVAIFHLVQVGKTVAEVNQLIDKRINLVTDSLKSNKEVSIYVDMLTFMPVYEYEVQKKLFSKNTYNEIPKGFEVKKNLHIRYKNPNDLNQIIALCAQSEIFNLVRVDLFSDQMEEKKRELMLRARKIMEEKISNRAAMVGVDFEDADKYMSDGYVVSYPIEKYTKFQAYSSSSLDLTAAGTVKTAAKNVGMYYKPVMNKDFDFVINAQIFEPVIQIAYEVKLRLIRAPKKVEKTTLKKPKTITKTIVKKKVLLITADGKVRDINLGS
jgi:uncharacterized protein YggE